MMAIQMTKYGAIKGGLCDQAHTGRRAREDGARWYLAHLDEKWCISRDNGWCRVARLPRLGWKAIAKAARGRGDGAYRSEWQNGVFRMEEVAQRLHEADKAFRWNQLETWLDAVCSLEFEIAAGPDLFPIAGRYREPHHNGIYQAKKANGDL